MPQRVVIQQQGPFIALSDENLSRLPAELQSALESPLYYTYVQSFAFGQPVYDPLTGDRIHGTSEKRRLFQYDERGRLVCQKGYLPKMLTLLAEHGCEVEVQNLNPPRPRTDCYTEDWDRVVSSFQFRPRQDECLLQIASTDGGIIDAPTAFGKSWLICMVCCLYPKAKIDVVTKSKDIVNTLHAMLTQWVPNVGRVGGGHRRQGRVTVYTADSLHHSEYDADIVLVDEAHQTLTDRLASMLNRYWYARMYGFTATKETRMDQAHYRLEGMFGPTIFYLDYEEAARQLGVVVPMVVQWLDVDMPSPIGNLTQTVAKKRHAYWRNDTRNQIIASACRQVWQMGMQTLVMVDTLDHALHLRRYLPEFPVVYSEGGLSPKKREEFQQMGLITASEPIMTSDRRNNLRLAFERRELLGAIATTVWNTGVSFNSLEVLARAEGGASATTNVQTPGRVSRIDPTTGKQVGILLDCNDVFDPWARQRTMIRQRDYASFNWTQYDSTGAIFSPRRRRPRGAA